MWLAVFTKNRTNPAYAAARLGADRTARALGSGSHGTEGAGVSLSNTDEMSPTGMGL